MTAVQKHHLYNLIVIGVTLGAFTVALPVIGAHRASGILGLMGLLAFGLVFVWKRKDVVVFDERDRLIESRARAAALAIFWGLFVLGCMGTWWLFGKDGFIPVRVLPIIMYLSWGFFQGAMSVAVLVQYWRWR